MARIYVSSTFNDLKEFREHVRLQLRQMGHEDIAMEYYVAENQRPLDKCLKDVATCDLYIGIFAQRYGYIPPEQQKSITEIEYRTAFDKRKDRLIFLLDEEASWPTKFVDKGKDAEKISSLRNELSQENLVSFFKYPHELKSLIATAVHNWEKKDGVIPQKKEAEELDIGSYQKAIESESASVNQISDIPKIKTQEEVHREKIKVCESLNKGFALNRLGKYQEAITAFDKALEIDPQDRTAWNNKGLALANLGKFQEAITAYDKGLEIDPGNLEEFYEKHFDKLLWNNKGLALYNLSKYLEAITAYDKALKIDPQFKIAWKNKGSALTILGKYHEAINAFDKALEIDPQDKLALINKEIALNRLTALHRNRTSQ